MAGGGGVLTEGRVAPRRGGFRVGLVGGDQGAECMGEGVVDLEACVGEADADLAGDSATPL